MYLTYPGYVLSLTMRGKTLYPTLLNSFLAKNIFSYIHIKLTLFYIFEISLVYEASFSCLNPTRLGFVKVIFFSEGRREVFQEKLISLTLYNSQTTYLK